MFESILNPVFSPLLRLPSLFGVIIIALAIAIIVTLIYKWTTDQHLMKTLKEDLKKFQEEMKQFKQDPKKVMEIQKRAMETNMKYMMHSMKPTLITLIPILIIFGWLNAHFAYESILPNTEFSTTMVFVPGTTGNATLAVPEQIELLSNAGQEIKDNQASWQLKGGAGEYLIEYEVQGRKYSKDLLITDQKEYKQPIKIVKDDLVNEIRIDNKKLKPFLGLSWIWTYIIFSIIFSMALRKILKIH